VREKIVLFNKKFFLSILTILFCFILDRISKIYVIKFFVNNKDIESYYVSSNLNIIFLWNKGIAFGLLQLENVVYHLISFLIFIIILFIFYLIIKAEKEYETIFLSCINGGALGNFFDRIYYQSVPDFIDFHINNYHWFTFNVADVFITFGIIMLLFFDIKIPNFKKKND